MKLPREIRICACGCNESFEVIISSKKRFVSGHNQRGTTISAAHRLAFSRANSGENNPAKRADVRLKKSISATGKKRTSESIQKQKETQKNNMKWKLSMKTRKPPRLGTKTSEITRMNMRIANKKHAAPSIETKQKTSQTLLKHFSIMENRIKRAKEIARRVQINGYQYKNGYITLPRLGLSFFYRSSYEQIGLLLLDSKQDVKNIFVETIQIPYVDSKGTTRLYIPDWLVVTNENEQYLIEVKPSFKRFDVDVLLKEKAAVEWCKVNNAVYCIWTEDILFNNSSTTMSLQAIVEATVTRPQGERYSLTSEEIQRKEQK